MSAPSPTPRILVFGSVEGEPSPLLDRFKSDHDFVVPDSIAQGLEDLKDDKIAGVLFLGHAFPAAGGLLETGGVLEQIPDAVVLVDVNLTILWSNHRLNELANCDENLVGQGFYDTFGTPEILGPDFCPFHTALGSGESARSTLRVGEKSYFEVHAKPVFNDEDEMPNFLVVIVRDVSTEVLQRQKLNAIYHAGLELGDLAPHELLEMSVGDRIELLKSKILHYTQDLLEFDMVEVRLVDKRTRQLEPLLAYGMQPDASDRVLYAEAQGNGVTGFVAATGKSYLCEDTGNDPLYLPGAPGRGVRSRCL